MNINNKFLNELGRTAAKTAVTSTVSQGISTALGVGTNVIADELRKSVTRVILYKKNYHLIKKDKKVKFSKTKKRFDSKTNSLGDIKKAKKKITKKKVNRKPSKEKKSNIKTGGKLITVTVIALSALKLYKKLKR